MTRKTAHDYDQELLALFDAYVHGDIDRRKFLARAAKFAVGGVTAAMLLDELSPDFVHALVLAADDSRLAAERVEIPSPAGHGTVRAYFVRPSGATGARGRLPGVLVIHENRGLNPHIEDVARRFALAGFAALAPDALTPLGGYPGDEDSARALFQKLEAEKSRADFVAAFEWLKGSAATTGRVGAVGFCWGGGIVNWLATRRADLGAAVPFYGSSPDPAEVAKIRAPLLIQSAEVDPRINESWPAFEAALKAAGVAYERHLYPGTQHGFHNDTTPRYDEAAAKLAWERTVAFFDRHLATAAASQPAPADAFLARIEALCEKAFAGRVVADEPPPKGADPFAGKALVMHVRRCAAGRVEIPFHVGTDRSRTWILTRTAAGLRLKHDHRHEDGSPDSVTLYGGDTSTAGSATRQEFPVDAESIGSFERAGLAASVRNVWAIEIEPGEHFLYELARPGGRLFRVEFDLRQPVPEPPAPWGAEAAPKPPPVP